MRFVACCGDCLSWQCLVGLFILCLVFSACLTASVSVLFHIKRAHGIARHGNLVSCRVGWLHTLAAASVACFAPGTCMTYQYHSLLPPHHPCACPSPCSRSPCNAQHCSVGVLLQQCSSCCTCCSGRGWVLCCAHHIIHMPCEFGNISRLSAPGLSS